MDDKIKQNIALETIKVLKSRMDSFPDTANMIRNAPFHKAFLRAFKSRLSSLHTDVDNIISISSWLHGFNTTLGQSFFENVANSLCDGEKRKFSGEEFKIYENQEIAIAEIMTNLKNGDTPPNVLKEDAILKENAHGKLITGTNFTVDCFFEDKNKIVAIELKSVRPNSGETRGEKQKILKAKAALRHYYGKIPGCQDKKVYYYFGFPFDPTADTDTGYCEESFMNNMVEFSKFCAPNEILLADKLWSFLSGEANTMAQILNIICNISNDTFYQDFCFLCMPHVIEQDSQKYREIISRWHLTDEVAILDHWNEIVAINDSQVKKQIYANIFKDNGELNTKRVEKLLSIISSTR